MKLKIKDADLAVIGTKVCRVDVVRNEKNIEILKSKFFQHQETSLHELQQRELISKRRVNGYDINSNLIIYADKRGAGKTRVICALLYEDKMDSKEYLTRTTISFACDSYSVSKTIKIPIIGLNIIIVSPSLVDQWSKELSLWGLRHTIVSTLRSIPRKILTKDAITIVTTHIFQEYWLYNKLGSEKGVKRIIYDEPDTAHIPNCPKIDYCKSLILVSATSNDLCNVRGKGSSHYLKHMYYNMDKEYQDLLTVKQPDQVIDATIVLPPVINRTLYFERNRIIDAIAHALPPDIRQMIMNGAIDDAHNAMGIKSTSETNLIKIATERLELNVKKIENSIELYGNNAERSDNLKKAKQQLADLIERIKESSHGDCAICYTEIVNSTVCPTCYNGYCRECIYTWIGLKNTCPKCQSKIDIHQLISLDKNGPNDDDEVKEDEVEQEKADDVVYSTRTDALIGAINACIKETPYPKVLLFTGYDQTQSVIVNYFKTRPELNYSVLKGSPKIRNDKIEEFRRGSTSFMVIDSRMDAAGIHLPETTHIIIHHEMSPNAEEQMIGRGNRIGRKDSLVVYRLCDK